MDHGAVGALCSHCYRVRRPSDTAAEKIGRFAQNPPICPKTAVFVRKSSEKVGRKVGRILAHQICRKRPVCRESARNGESASVFGEIPAEPPKSAQIRRNGRKRPTCTTFSYETLAPTKSAQIRRFAPNPPETGNRLRFLPKFRPTDPNSPKS